MERRIHNEDVRAAQELMTYELNYERWKAVHMSEFTEELGENYEGVKEFYPSEIDAFLARIESGGDGEMSASEVTMSGGGVYGMEI